MSTNVYINDQPVSVGEFDTVLDAVNQSGTYLPQLCKDADMNAIGACRTCLVEIEGRKGFVAACSVQATKDLKVHTETDELRRIRSGVLQLTLAMVSGAENGDYGDLSVAAKHHGIKEARWQPRQREQVDSSNPVFDIAMESCILCTRCTVGCQEGAQFIGAIDMLGTNLETKVGTFMDKPLLESVCTTCGQCLSVCPTGAIRVKNVSQQTTTVTDTTCPYCGVGCGIKVKVDEKEEIVEVSDDPRNPSSVGMLCVKGRFGTTFVNHPDRIREPLIKRNGVFEIASWDEALEYTARKLKDYRNGSFATLCSAKATNEDGYIQQKFARLVMKSNHIDHCTRLCHSPSVEAMLTSLGSGATSNSYIDYEQAGCLMVVGSDATSNHPVAAARIKRAVVEKGAKLIIINPKRIDLCQYADLWLRPNPGTDVALLNGLAKAIIDQGLVDETFVQNRTEGYKEWRKVVDEYSPEKVEQITSVSAREIRLAGKFYAKPDFSGSCLIWGMGITQHTNGTANAHSLLNLAFVAGQLGKEGSGISPLRGQNNVQGCGDAGCLPNSLPGYQLLTEETIKKFSDRWQGDLPKTPGLVVTDMVERISDGTVKAMYITGENPMLSEPNLRHAESLFKQLEFLVVQDIFMHETAVLADVIFPATSFAEKDGTFTNSERRVQRVRKAMSPRHQSRPDWQIICDLANTMDKLYDLRLQNQFKFLNPSEIWDEMASLTPIVGGINYSRLDNEGGLQWPCRDLSDSGTRFLYQDSFPIGERAKFVAFKQGKPAAELPNRKYPLLLNTGRTLYHWHGGTITRRARHLLARAPNLHIAMHPEDARVYSVDDGETVILESRRGTLEGQILCTDAVKRGEVFVPFLKLGTFSANYLTNSVYDPVSKIPEYKVCAVRVNKLVNERA